MLNKIQGWVKAIFKPDFLLTIVLAFVLAIIFRTTLYEHYLVPSGSMTPNLIQGDHLFAEKFAYGYGKYSVPYDLYLLKNRYFNKAPERGDIVIFRKENDSQFYVKRLIGLPNEEIKIFNNKLVIDGNVVERKLVGEYRSTVNNEIFDKYEETLPNGISYFTINKKDRDLSDGLQVYKIPNNHYFVMGDNRHNSIDSRFLDRMSFIPKENIVATPRIIIWDGNFSVLHPTSNPHSNRFLKIF